MGTDIHLYVEKKINNLWKACKPHKELSNRLDSFRWNVVRNYSLFGILAGVRSNIKPILKPQGFPKNASLIIAKKYKKEKNNSHTPSRLLLSKLIPYKDKIIYNKGYVNKFNYGLFKKHGEPFSIYNKEEIDLDKYQIISNKEMDSLILNAAFANNFNFFTEIEYNHTYNEYTDNFWDIYVPYLQSLDKNPNNVRLVFWFDN